MLGVPGNATQHVQRRSAVLELVRHAADESSEPSRPANGGTPSFGEAPHESEGMVTVSPDGAGCTM